MFKEARINLTVWYLAIIMSISLSFSVVIYAEINRELLRLDSVQRVRQEHANEVISFLRLNGLPIPLEPVYTENETVEVARLRIISILGLINFGILIISGAGGYFLAGRTLDPIKKNMNDQKSFVSDASHELRTPLTSLKTEIEVALRDKKLNLSDAKILLKSNLEEVDRMQKLANYLLTMSRYGERKNYSKNKVNLKEIVQKTVGKQKIILDLQNSNVYADRNSLEELILILLDNAKKYGQGKPVKIVVKRKKISVIDQGVGISKEDLPHIFDRFYRSDKSRGTEGYGLGLSIAKSIAELNNAVINVVTKPGKGSTFIVLFK